MHRYQREGQLIATIYEAAVHPRLWEQVAKLLADYTNSQMCYLFLNRDQGMQRIVEFGLDPAIHKDYLHFMDGDIWLEKASAQSAPSTVRSDELIPLKEYKKTEFFNEICVPADVAYMGGVVATKNNLDTIIYSCHRRESRGSFSVDEVQMMARFARHFANAIFLETNIQNHKDEIATLRSTLDRSRYGVIFCDGDGRVVWENRKASRMLSRADGLRVVAGRLRALLHGDNARLSKAIYAAGQASTGQSTNSGARVCVRRNSGRNSYKLSVMPGVRSWKLADTPEVVIFVADPSAPPVVSHKSLKQFYDLTEAEARVCAHIARGRTVPEIADQFSLSKNTVRTQLKSVFQKCDVSSQVQLMRLLSTLEL